MLSDLEMFVVLGIATVWFIGFALGVIVGEFKERKRRIKKIKAKGDNQ